MKCTATMAFNLSASSAQARGPVVKATSGTSHCYVAFIYLSASVHYLRIAKQGTTLIVVATVALSEPVAPYGKLSLEWNAGTLTAVLDDTVTLTGSDSDYAAYAYCGYKTESANYPFNAITIVGGTDPALAVSPVAIPNYGECSTVVLTGTNTAWTPGTPGAPTFTCNHGTISAQTVDSETQATLTYCPGDFLGTVTFTDPSTGATGTALVSSDPGVVPPGDQCRFHDDFIDLANDTADHYSGDLTRNNTTVVVAAEGLTEVTLIQAISDLWQAEFRTDMDPPSASVGGILLKNLLMWVSGGYLPTMATPDPPSQTTLKEDLDALRARLSLAQTGGSYDAGTLMREIAGFPGGSIQDVLDALDGIGGGDNTAVLEAIAALRGDTTTTVAQLLTSLGQIRTTHTYTLGDVKGWIDGINDPDNGPILLALAALSLAVGAGFVAEEASVAAVAGVAAGTATEVLGIAAAIIDVLSLLGRIAEAISALQTPTILVPPIWPGTGNATVASDAALVNGMTISGPLHGLYISITDTPHGAGRYSFGDVNSWTHAGAVVFCNDEGAYERAQQFGLDLQILTPKEMVHAASAIIRLNGGYSGRVSKWTINV
jgi:hypothetical protein